MRGKFKRILEKALPIAEEYQTLTSGPVKLSYKGMMAEALKIAGCDEAELKRIDEILGEKQQELRYVNMFSRNCQRWCKERTFTRPTADTRRYVWLAGPRYDAVIAEASLYGISIYKLVAHAIWKVNQSHPEAWGTIDDYAEYNNRVAELKTALENAYKEIEDSYTGEDLIFSGPITRDGMVRVTFAITNSEVCIGPDCGRRLTEWCLRHKEIFDKG